MFSVWPALQRKSHLCVPRKGIARPQSQFPHGPLIFLQQNRQTLTDTWMWKLGLRPRNSFSGNIYIELTVLCLCSVSFFVTSVKLHCADCFHDQRNPTGWRNLLWHFALSKYGIRAMKRKNGTLLRTASEKTCELVIHTHITHAILASCV